MEEGLLLKQRDERLTWRALLEEMKKLGIVAGPMVAVTLSQYLLQVTSVMMVGHLGELALSSTSIAMSLSGVTGFSLMYSSSCEKTRSPISVEVFHGTKQFFTFAIPSAVMICLESWSYEFVILLSGLLPNPELESSVLSICLNTISTLYAIPYAFAAGVSTRVSNELGAGNPRGARVAVNAIMILAVVETTIVSIVVFLNRHIFGYIFTNEKEVVDYVTKIAPLICINIVMDGLQGTLLGVARGAGWQDLGAYANLVAFYLVGIPVAALLGFRTSLRGEGLWTGTLVGVTIQVFLLSVVTFCTNYEKQATKAKERLLEEECLTQDVLM